MTFSVTRLAAADSELEAQLMAVLVLVTVGPGMRVRGTPVTSPSQCAGGRARAPGPGTRRPGRRARVTKPGPADDSGLS